MRPEGVRQALGTCPELETSGGGGKSGGKVDAERDNCEKRRMKPKGGHVEVYTTPVRDGCAGSPAPGALA